MSILGSIIPILYDIVLICNFFCYSNINSNCCSFICLLSSTCTPNTSIKLKCDVGMVSCQKGEEQCRDDSSCRYTITHNPIPPSFCFSLMGSSICDHVTCYHPCLVPLSFLAWYHPYIPLCFYICFTNFIS